MEERLIYRRQFLIARKAMEKLSDWQRMKVGHYWLHVHPDLQMTELGTPSGACATWVLV